MNFDLDGDGKDELLMGYTLYGPSGKELWSHPEFGLHNDAVYIEDVDGDGRAEISIATSKDCVLLDAQGKILFRKEQDHCQHTQIGKFRPDIDGKQIFYVSRGNKHPDEAYRPSVAVLYDRKGRELWQTRENFWWMGSVRVDRWTAEPQALIGLYSRGFDPPALIDGFGRTVAVFPFPPSITKPGGGPGGRDVYGDDYIQHLDCWGDEREEILVFNDKALYVYTNAAVWQKPRLYNGNYYPGRL